MPAPVPDSPPSSTGCASCCASRSPTSRPTTRRSAPSAIPVDGIVTWRDPWANVVAGGHQYATVAEHPGSSWTYSETLVPRSTDLDAFGDRRAAGILALEALRIAAWRPRAATELDAHGDPARARLDPLGRAPREGLLPRAGDRREGAQPRASAAAARDAAPRRFRQCRGRSRATRCCSARPVVGRVTASATHYELGPIALAVVRRNTDPAATLTVATSEGVVAAAQEVIVPTDAGAEADVPRLPRLGAVQATA